MTNTKLKELLSKYDAGVLAAYCAPAEGEREMFCPSQQWAALARQVLELRAKNAALAAMHASDMNDIVLLGLARDEERARAEAAEARLRGIAEIAREYTANETHYRWLTAVMKRILALATETNNE